ncbi:MAG: hypothetical protein ACTSWY_14040 [Promethearchaeota archaeon]
MIIANESREFNFTIQIDSMNRYFGTYIEAAISMRWYNPAEIYPSYVLNCNDNFEINLNIHPRTDRTFGPLILITPTYSVTSTSTGGILTTSINVKNIGDRIANNLVIQYSTGSSTFSYYGGQVPYFNFGPLLPGEEFTEIVKLELDKDFIDTYSIQFPIFATYSTGADWVDPITLISYQNLYISTNGSSGVNPTIGLTIALIAVIGVLVLENAILFKKRI